MHSSCDVPRPFPRRLQLTRVVDSSVPRRCSAPTEATARHFASYDRHGHITQSY